MASAERLRVAPLYQRHEHLEGDSAGSLRHVPPAVSQCRLASQHVAVVPVHISESAGALVTPAAIQLHQEPVLLVVDIGAVGQVSPTLTGGSRKIVGPFDIAQVGQFQAGLDAVGIGQQLGQELAPGMPGSALERCTEPLGRGQPEPQGVGHERDHIPIGPRPGEIENCVLHGQPRTRADRLR